MKKRWKTDAIVAALKAALPDCKIEVEPPGGDCDTENIIVNVKRSGRLFICGFNVEYDNGPDDPSDWEVEYVELTDGEDSAGGLNSNKSKMIDAYAASRKVLAKFGFTIVPCLKNYF